MQIKFWVLQGYDVSIGPIDEEEVERKRKAMIIAIVVIVVILLLIAMTIFLVSPGTSFNVCQIKINDSFYLDIIKWSYRNTNSSTNNFPPQNETSSQLSYSFNLFSWL